VSVSIVVPCYRSAGTLPALVARVNEVMPRVAAAYEVILVVDSTGDGTWEVAQELAEASGPVRAIQMARNYGQHNAIVAGVRAARYDVVVTMDDDLQHLPEQIPVLLGALTAGVDLVYGLPVEEEHGFLRSLASRGVKAGLSSAMGVNNARNVSAFRAFRTFLRNGFDLVSGPHVCVDVALSWATTRVTAVKVQMADRTEGQHKGELADRETQRDRAEPARHHVRLPPHLPDDPPPDRANEQRSDGELWCGRRADADDDDRRAADRAEHRATVTHRQMSDMQRRDRREHQAVRERR